METKQPMILGEVAIPHDYDQTKINKARFSRSLLNSLREGKALLVEFETHREAENYRAMLYSMAILKYGEAGRIATRIVENLLYVWLVDQITTPIEANVFFTRSV